MIFTGQTTTVVHKIIDEAIQEGSMALDGTVGNGNDTLFLAHRVGANGKVYGFDIQAKAIEETRSKLLKEKLDDRVELIHDTHAHIDNYVTEGLDLAIFNLGYLPNGNKTIITEAKSTIEAIRQCLRLLKKGGILAITVYYGHDGGAEEKNAVEKAVKELDFKLFNVVKVDFFNRPNCPPIVYIVEKF